MGIPNNANDENSIQKSQDVAPKKVKFDPTVTTDPPTKQTISSPDTETLGNTDLAQLLLRQEDKILHKQAEIEAVKIQVAESGFSNQQMVSIVEEFDKTLSQLIEEKEKCKMLLERKKEDKEEERNQVLEDLASVERALSDHQRKFQRTKEMISVFRRNEDTLKAAAESVFTSVTK